MNSDPFTIMSISVPISLRDNLKDEANQLGISVSALFRQIWCEYLESRNVETESDEDADPASMWL